MKKYSQLHESFYHEIYRIQAITKVFCYKSLELYGIKAHGSESHG